MSNNLSALDVEDPLESFNKYKREKVLLEGLLPSLNEFGSMSDVKKVYNTEKVKRIYKKQYLIYFFFKVWRYY